MKLRLVVLARVLALLWAGFWIAFFVAESAARHTPPRARLPWAGAGLFFLLLALVPWRWEKPGGVLLIITGLLLGAAYALWSPPQLPLASRIATAAVFSGPPVIAGILFLLHRRDAARV